MSQNAINLKLHTVRNKDFLVCSQREYIEPIKNWLGNNLFSPCSEWDHLFYKGRKENCYLITLPYSNKKIFLKCFGLRNKKFHHKLVSEGCHAFRTAFFLVKRNIPTAEPLAYGLIKRGPNYGKELLFTLWISDSVNLRVFSQNFFSLPKNARWIREKRELANNLAGFVCKIHSEGVYNGDFQDVNILVLDRGDIELFLIDTPGIRSIHSISHRRVIKNLDETNRFFLNISDVTRTDRLRFLKKYLGEKAENRKVLRRYWREVEKRTMLRLKIDNKSFFR